MGRETNQREVIKRKMGRQAREEPGQREREAERGG